VTTVFVHGARNPPVHRGTAAIAAELRARGERTAIVLPAALADAHPAVHAHYDRVIALPGAFDDNALVEAEIFALHAATPIANIVSVGEAAILRAARLREALGVPVQSVASALAYRDKVDMKQRVARAGVRVPRYRAVDAPSDLLAFVRDVGYPVVLKPRSGAGGVDTVVLRDAGAVRALAGAIAGGDEAGAHARARDMLDRSIPEEDD